MNKWNPTDWFSSTQPELYENTEYISIPPAAALVKQAANQPAPVVQSHKGHYRVLDAGTGMGQIVNEVVHHEAYEGATVVCSDIDDSLLDIVAGKAKEGAWSDRVELANVDVQYPIQTLRSPASIHSSPEFRVKLTISESIRILKPGGILAFATWARSGPFHVLMDSIPLGVPRPPPPSAAPTPTSAKAAKPPPGPRPPIADQAFIDSYICSLPLTDIKCNKITYSHTRPTARELAVDMRVVIHLLASKWPEEVREKHGWEFFENVEKTIETKYKQADGSVAIESEVWIVTATKKA